MVFFLIDHTFCRTKAVDESSCSYKSYNQQVKGKTIYAKKKKNLRLFISQRK